MDIGTKEYGEMYGVSSSTVAKWCRKGLLNGATQDEVGCPWHIDPRAEAPYGHKKIKN